MAVGLPGNYPLSLYQYTPKGIQMVTSFVLVIKPCPPDFFLVPVPREVAPRCLSSGNKRFSWTF
jgi:hypothetical protein